MYDIKSKFSIENIEFKDNLIPNQPPEKYYGNREYKRKIIKCDKSKIVKRSTQLLFRLYEGNGKALYLIGIDDDGIIYGLSKEELLHSFNNFYNITKMANCSIKKATIYHKNNKYILSFRLFKNLNTIILD